MDPVFQRLGDVTIQRVEKPKAPQTGGPSGPPEVSIAEKTLERIAKPPEIEPEAEDSFYDDEEYDSEEFDPEDEDFESSPPNLNLKRNLGNEVEITAKKFKLNSQELTFDRKSDIKPKTSAVNIQNNISSAKTSQITQINAEKGQNSAKSSVSVENSAKTTSNSAKTVQNIQNSAKTNQNSAFANLNDEYVENDEELAKYEKMRAELGNFSDEDYSDYEDESEYPSDEDDLPPLPDFDEPPLKTTQIAEKTPKTDEDSNETFLDKLAEVSSILNPVGEENEAASCSTKKTPEPPADAEDYDIDIKEKLKEMGVSFESVKKGEKTAKKLVETTENEVVVTPAKKPGSGDEDTSERKGTILNMRRNIREVMDETKLDEATLAAQRLEAERLQRVQEQQKLLRELQRQAAQERMQNKVLSLLQGHPQGHQASSSRPGPSNISQSHMGGSTVLVKLPNGQTKPMTRLPKRPFDLVKVHKSGMGPMAPSMGGSSLLQMPSAHAQMPGMSPQHPPGANLTPSVSIAPVSKKSPVMPIKKEIGSESESDGEGVEKKKKPAPPTIDISSDDDCIVVSEPEGEDDETSDDPSNSGLHTNDAFNQPDAEGRVIINIGHPEDEPDIFLAPQISRIIKPHQIGGVRFLYDNVIESTSRFEHSEGFGCILAHSMGLGKTLQIVCFSDIFLRHTTAKTILCIMPINTLQNWLAEYNMWLPTEEGAANSPLLTHGEVRPRKFNIHVLNDSHKTLTARAKVISVWRNEGGVLLIGYEQYRLLSMKKHPKTRRKTNNLMEPPDDSKNKVMFDAVHEALVRPGPDLVICDEGHRIKNSHASISHALKQMKTKRRIVLTGYPLQNNLMEYWCMVDFARPNYLGSKTEFCNMFERPIMNGQCIDSTDGDIKLMRYRAHVLHSLLVGFVQRRSHTVLQTSLPQKEEYVLLVRMTPFQRDLYETFMNEVVRIQAVPNPLKAFAVCCKIWNHPDVLYNFLVKRAKGDIARDIDLEEVASVTSSTTTEMGGTTPLKAKRGPGKPRKATGKGKNGKPAASVTPYNSQSDISHINPQNTLQNNSQNNPHNNALNTPQNNPPNNSQNSQFFDQSLTQFPATFGSNNSNSTYPHETSSSNFTDSSYLDNMSIQNTPENSKNYMDLSLNNQPKNEFPNNFNGPFNQFNQNFEQPPQNQWGGTQQQNDFFEHSQSNSNSSWFKKESENSQDSKPKINIISDIKLPHLSPVKTKINIISDIKIEPKKEEEDSKNEELKPEMKDEKQELQIAAPENLLKGLNLKDKDDSGIPYDWAVELLKHYLPGCIANSGKMEILFCIIKESIALGDRLLVFSQSLVTLDLIEQFLQAREIPGDTIKWAKNSSYYRLDGSTSALEREKLINEYNSNPKIHLFLVSTRAGSLGINLIGANRVVVLDASWNPCHDTQAVCRVYRYGQRKPCFVYRLVVDNCMEKKIYDRQISKQGMSDRVVDECNPDPHLTMRDVSTLCWDNKYDEGEEKDWAHVKDNYIDVVLQKVLEKHGRRLNCEPFQHESLLVDRKEKQLSSLEKRLAKKSYEREKQASLYSSGPVPRGHRPVASVRPMQQGPGRPSRWIPAEHWQRQGMTAQEMTLPLDVVIPTNQPEKSNIVLKAGQKVLVLKSPKGVYMQLESGKIVAIKTAIKVKGKAEENASGVGGMLDKLGGGPPKPPLLPPTMRVPPSSQMQQRKIVKPFTPGVAKMNIRSVRQNIPNLSSAIQNAGRRPPNTPKTRPYKIGTEIAKAVTSQNSENENLLLHSEEHHLQMHNPPPQNYPHDFQGVQGGKPPQMPQMDETLPQQDLLENIGGKTPRGRKKPVRKTGGAPRGRKKATPTSSSLEKLEETASLALNDNLAFQETLDSITNPHHSSSSYTKDDSLLEDVDTPQSTPNPPENYPNVSASVSDTSDHSDEVTYVSEQPSTSNPPTYPPQDIQPPPNPTEYQQPQPQYPQYPQQQNQYYQPYPPQQAGYVYPPAYDMNNPYPQQAPPPPPMQYNYAYPQQGYVQPPPVQMGGMYPPPTPYDYNAAPPPQPIYHGGYYAPPPVQNYPPPPQQGMYAPPVQQQQSGGYQGEYQYNAQPPAVQPPQGGAVVPPQQQNYYPNA